MHAVPQDADTRAPWEITRRQMAVEWFEIENVPRHAEAAVSHFRGASGIAESHVTVCLKDKCADPAGALEDAWLAALDAAGLSPESTLLRRVFHHASHGFDAELARFAHAHPGSFSVIGQPPLPGGQLAVWSQHLRDPRAPLVTSGGGTCFSCTRGNLRHHWLTALCDTTGDDPASQAARILEQHDHWLSAQDMNLADHVVRTWWFVRDIDRDYQALVDVRRGFFATHQLTEDTHYIASTGIAGGHDQASARMSLDSYAIAGLGRDQVEYLSAPEHLGPTHHYGVTFERATAISYADRKHVIISGTASIDPTGEIVHPGNVMRQLDRSLENVSALLDAAGAGLDDLAMILVYLRDPADGAEIRKALRERFRRLPTIVLHAPVCRPGWLVEVEGIALVSAKNPGLPEI